MIRRFCFLLCLLTLSGLMLAQGTSGSVSGTVNRPHHRTRPQRVGHHSQLGQRYTRTTQTDANGQYRFYNIPFNPYRISVSSSGFQSTSVTIDVNSTVPVASLIKLDVEGGATSVTVIDNGADLVENDSTFPYGHRSLHHRQAAARKRQLLPQLAGYALLPAWPRTRTASSTGLGDHAENSFSVDASRSLTSRARCSRTSFRRTQSSPSK